MYFDNEIAYKKTLPYDYKEEFVEKVDSVPFNYMSSTSQKGNIVEFEVVKDTSARLSAFLKN